MALFYPHYTDIHRGVSIVMVVPLDRWKVDFMENPTKWMRKRGTPMTLEISICCFGNRYDQMIVIVMYMLIYVFQIWWYLSRPVDRNRARKINSCSWGGVGWGGLLTSFVLTTTLLSFLTTSSYVLDVTLLIDAAWSALRQYIPNCLSSHSRNLILYCKSWQWRYINFHGNVQKKTIEALKCILWENVSLQCSWTGQWKWAVTVAKRENVSILPTFFGVILRCKNRRLAKVRSSFWEKKTLYFYEYSFRSAGFIVPCRDNDSVNN